MCDCVWSHQCYLQPPSQCYLPRYQRYLRTTLIDSVVGNIGLVGQIFPPDRFSCSPGGHLSPFQSVFINFSWRCFNVFASRVRRCPTTISAREWSTWLCLHCCDVKSLQSYNVRFNSIHVVWASTFWALFGAKAPYSLWEWNALCRLGPGRNSPGQDNSDVRNVTRWWRYKVTRWGRCVAQSVVTTRWWTWLLQSTSPPSTLTYTGDAPVTHIFASDLKTPLILSKKLNHKAMQFVLEYIRVVCMVMEMLSILSLCLHL